MDTQVTNVIKEKNEWPNAVKLISAWDNVISKVAGILGLWILKLPMSLKRKMSGPMQLS